MYPNLPQSWHYDLPLRLPYPWSSLPRVSLEKCHHGSASIEEFWGPGILLFIWVCCAAIWVLLSLKCEPNILRLIASRGDTRDIFLLSILFSGINYNAFASLTFTLSYILLMSVESTLSYYLSRHAKIFIPFYYLVSTQSAASNSSKRNLILSM